MAVTPYARACAHRLPCPPALPPWQLPHPRPPRTRPASAPAEADGDTGEIFVTAQFRAAEPAGHAARHHRGHRRDDGGQEPDQPRASRRQRAQRDAQAAGRLVRPVDLGRDPRHRRRRLQPGLRARRRHLYRRRLLSAADRRGVRPARPRSGRDPARAAGHAVGPQLRRRLDQDVHPAARGSGDGYRRGDLRHPQPDRVARRDRLRADRRPRRPRLGRLQAPGRLRRPDGLRLRVPGRRHATFTANNGTTQVVNPAGGMPRVRPEGSCRVDQLGEVGYQAIRGALR